jgi:hypothetical protein
VLEHLGDEPAQHLRGRQALDEDAAQHIDEAVEAEPLAPRTPPSVTPSV